MGKAVAVQGGVGEYTVVAACSIATLYFVGWCLCVCRGVSTELRRAGTQTHMYEPQGLGYGESAMGNGTKCVAVIADSRNSSV